ncbi:hypothetical protein E2C01_084965 [Portunus trituberculatus]|uniref:Uncharacterized protein n=1 Tax=Portunus trituberculatus TaxID=210409 RepID=A0A5B7J5I0_PORTR|nr:hypothetical protein [Portunus trituberculatus]
MLELRSTSVAVAVKAAVEVVVAVVEVVVALWPPAGLRRVTPRRPLPPAEAAAHTHQHTVQRITLL